MIRILMGIILLGMAGCNGFMVVFSGNKNTIATGIVLGGLFFLISILFLSSGVRALAGGKMVDHSQDKKCPHCAEYVKREAVVCKHCGRDLGGVR